MNDELNVSMVIFVKEVGGYLNRSKRIVTSITLRGNIMNQLELRGQLKKDDSIRLILFIGRVHLHA